LGEFVASCTERGVQARVVPVTVASHSPQVEPLRDRLVAMLGGIEAADCPVPFYSTVTGDMLSASTLTAGYWYDNARDPVRFESAIRNLLKAGYETFIEASPHP